MIANPFRVRLLPPGGRSRVGAVDRAYALAAAVDSRLTPGRWAEFVRRCRREAGRRGGIGVLEDRRGYVHAVFRYAVCPAPLGAAPVLARGSTMWLRDVVVGHLPGGAAVRGLAAGAEVMARAFGCVAVALELPAPADPALAGTPYAPLSGRGYGLAAGPVMVRALDA
ncbi:MAG: hypothetical protein AB7O45_16945 [Alphaproteobacteria bacterium]